MDTIYNDSNQYDCNDFHSALYAFYDKVFITLLKFAAFLILRTLSRVFALPYCACRVFIIFAGGLVWNIEMKMPNCFGQRGTKSYDVHLYVDYVRR